MPDEPSAPPRWWLRYWLSRLGIDLAVWISLAAFIAGMYVGQRKGAADIAELRETQRRDTVMFTVKVQEVQQSLARIQGNQAQIVGNQVRGSSDMHVLANQIRGDLRELRKERRRGR